MDRSESMGKGRIWPLLVRFSGPSVISMMIASSYNLVDAIVVGHLGTDALAALAIAFPLMIIYAAIVNGIGIGTSSLVSRSLGAGKRKEADNAACIGIVLFLILAALIPLVVLPNLERLLILFGASGNVLNLARTYMRIETSFTILNFFSVVTAEVIRAEGNPVLASASSIVSGVTDSVMSPTLTYGWGPFPKMGIAGAAVGTSVGRGLASLILITYLVTGKSSFHFRPSYFIPKLKTIVEILRIGSSSMVRMAGGSFVQILADRVASSFGVIPLAVLGCVFKVQSFASMPCMGIAQGMLPLVGYNHGAKQNQRVGEVVTKATLLSFSWVTFIFVIAMLFASPILSIFNTDPAFLGLGATVLRIFAFSFLTVGPQMVMSAFFQGLGRGLPALIVSASRQVIFLIPCVLILPWLFGLTGLWLAYPIADGLALILTLSWTIAEFRRLGLNFRLILRQSFTTVANADPPDINNS
jgi:putative MATE family efflux protein